MDVLKLNLLQNDAERIQARVTNPRQPLWLSKTRTSWASHCGYLRLDLAGKI